VPRIGRRLPRPVSEPDLMRALAMATPRIRPWLVLAGWCGLRAKEIAYLRRECVLETAGPPVLLVARDATKGRSERVVPLSAFAVAELVPVLPAAGWVFRRMDGRPGPNTPGLISHLANAHLHECGVAASLHALRHRFASETYKASRDLRAVQSLMGHARPETTALYAAYDQPSARAAVDALPVPERLRVVPVQDAG
jgi:integrase